MTTTIVSSIRCSEGPPPSSGRFSKSAGTTSEIFQAISSSQSSLTPFTKRKVSFDESGGISNNDLDVTSRFLTSQYTRTRLEASSPSFYSGKTCCCPNLCNDTKTQVYWDSGSRNNAAASSRKTKSSHDIIPSCKPTVTSRMSRLSRSGCLCLLDGDTSAKRRRSVKGSAIPSVSEDDMTVDSALLEVRLENEHMMDDDVVASASVLPSMSQVQLQVQLQLQLEEEKSDSSDEHDDYSIVQPPTHYWGHFVDFLSPGPEESKACKYKRRNTNRRTRYRSYHSKTPTSAKQSFPFRVSSKTDHVYTKDDTFLQSNNTEDEEISRAIERISL